MKKTWWKEAVVYQIYPRSFMDSNGDGIGDLPGIIGRLDYLRELGADVLWLSPVYQSPNDDNGYDISDYRAILPEFGTMEDFKELLAQAHKRGLRILMDLVVNHTSDEHPWFAESRSSRENPRRDYYIWRDGKNGGPPNNWASIFSGSAWEYDEATGQYYLHLFSRKQPDLNWENPAVRREIYDMMNWWLELGIDGFRLDTANMYSKAPGLPDMPGEGLRNASPFYQNGPRIHEFLREMNRETFGRCDVMTVGETSNVTPETALPYVREDAGELHMLFQFEHMGVDGGRDKWDPVTYEPKRLMDVLTRWQYGLAEEGWNSQYLNNHDQPRQVSRFGDDGELRAESAKLLATLLHTLKGTPYIYQGEELGMTNCPFEVSEFRDVEIKNLLRERSPDPADPPAALLYAIRRAGRDNARTPMQWTAGRNAGFTAGEPWIKVNPNHGEINAEAALRDPDSVLHYYKRLISLRREHPVMVYGRFDRLNPGHDRVFCYTRSLDGDVMTVVLNMTRETLSYRLPSGTGAGRLLLNNYPRLHLTGDDAGLLPYQALVFLK